MKTEEFYRAYFSALSECALHAVATSADNREIPVPEAVDWAIKTARTAHKNGNKLMFIGNGGSAGIASHMAIDYSKNGSLRSLALNDGAALTCLSNDLGFENVFSRQIGLHARPGDLLIAISSSGKSANILNGVGQARTNGCSVLTLSGFSEGNPLRRMGDINLYVPATEYGFVEITHLALLHAVLDRAMGLLENK